MPVVIAVYFEGHVIQRRINVVRNRQSVQIGNVGAPPDMVLFDPNENLLRELTFPQPVTRLAFQARHARHVADREWALSQLAALRVTSAIARAARSDPFYGVRADAVASAARLGDSATVLAALRDRDVRVRIAAENASMYLPGPNYSLISALRGMTQDANPDVTDAAYTALGALRAPDAYALLTRVRAFRGLALLGDARALPFLVAKTAYGVPERERNAAVAALAQLARGIHHPEVALPVLLRLAAHDPLVSTRLAAVSALGELGDAGAVPTLRQIENGDTQELVRIQAWNALMTLSPMTILPSGWVLSPPQGAAVATGTMPQGMALSPDGTRLAVVEAGYNAPALSIYRLPNLAHVASIPLPGAFGRPVWTDHIHVAIAGANTDAVLVVDVNTKTVGRIALPKKTYPLYIASAQNGLYAVATARDEAVRIAPLHGLGTARPVHLGGFPGGLAFSPDGSTLFATDRSNSRLVAIDARTLRIEARAFTRLHPCAVVVSGRRMYVAESDADAIGVFEYAAHRLREIAQISVADRTPGHELGVSPNSLFAAGKTIYATLGAANSVAVIRDGSVLGRLAAGWYPTDVLTVTDRMYVLNGKGEGARPNPYLRPGSDRDYIAAIEFGSLRQYALPKRLAPDGNPQGAFGWSADPPPSPIRAGGPIKHVIFILKENRTYDQILGDVAEGRGDPQLAWFGGTTTPNEHALARRFGLFDDAYTNGEVSAVGHMWSDAAFSNDSMERFWPSIYANRNDLDALAQVDDLLSDSAGFLWDAARRAHVSFRDYGELVNPGKTAGEWVAAVPSLKGRFDPHYAGWDLHISDTERVREWRREFQGFVRSGRLPQFEFVWLPNDHTAGSKPGELTPPAYVAQNDYALGQIVDTISHSRVWRSSAIFVIEDDAQAGPDHISDQRTTLFIASPYARPGVHHEHYTTASVLRTIEIVLGLKPLSTYDAMAVPMGSVFTQTPDMRPYDVIAPQIDVNRRNAATAFGAQQSAHLDFSRPDAASPRILNEILAHNH
jgi:DNA-binding beta-propeller fold protein YncE